MKPRELFAFPELPKVSHKRLTCLGVFAVLSVLLLVAGVAAGATLEELQAAVQQSPQDAGARYALGNHYYDQRDFSNAEQQYSHAVSLDRNHVRSHFKLGNIYFHTGRLSKAEETFKTIIAIEDKYAAPHLNLGTIYEQQRKFSPALEEYEKAKALSPDNPGGLFGMGDVYYQTEEWEKAIACYEGGLKLMAVSPADEEDRQDREITEKFLKTAREIQANGGVVPAGQIYQSLAVPSGTREATFVSTAAPGGVVLRKILFATNKYSYESLDAASRRQLEELVKALKRIEREGGLALLIEGHTDVTGNARYNEQLSLRRAETVRDCIVKSGISASRIRVKGFGSNRPAFADKDENANRLNRRVVVKRLPSAPPSASAASSSGATTATAQAEPTTPKAPDLSIRVFYEDSQGKARELAKGAKLPFGTKYRVEFRPGLKGECYAYVLRERGKGAIECIFPAPVVGMAGVGAGGNPIPAQEWTRLPAKNDFYSVAGADKSLVIRFYASGKPIDSLEDLLAEGTEVATIRTRGILAMPEPDRPAAVRPPVTAPVGEKPAATEPPKPTGRIVSAAVLGSLPKPSDEIEIRVE